jgi:hypothetical protein
MEQISEPCMDAIDKYRPEEGDGEPEFVDHLLHAGARRILADLFLKTVDPKWPDQYYGHIHVYPLAPTPAFQAVNPGRQPAVFRMIA